MASNRAITPWAAVAAHQLPDAMLKVTLIPGRPPRGRRNCKVLLQFQAHFPSGRWQQLHKLCRMGQQGRPRHQVRRGPAEVPGVNDPCELERWNPKLKLIREISAYSGSPRLPGIRRLLASTPDFWRQAQPCPRKGRAFLPYRFQNLGV
jgi:hypothetical protein